LEHFSREADRRALTRCLVPSFPCFQLHDRVIDQLAIGILEWGIAESVSAVAEADDSTVRALDGDVPGAARRDAMCRKLGKIF